MTSEPLLAFKAGRSQRREGTNFVDAMQTKGIISLHKEDDLLHFKWTNRLTGETEEDLILFPQDASFSKVSQAPGGRTYILKFMSSNQKHFSLPKVLASGLYWHTLSSLSNERLTDSKDKFTARDEEFARNVNVLLENPEGSLTWNIASGSSTNSQVPASEQAAASSVTSSLPQLNADQLARLRELVATMASEPAPVQPTVSLSDVLTVETLSPLFTNHPDLISALFPHLPPDLPMPPSEEVLQRVIASPQFQTAVGNFDQALHTGLLGGLVRGLGLPEEAGTGVEPFLRAVQDQARREGGGSNDSGASSRDEMETD
ncbi:hypothetical protein EW145_g1311 [Phellinidium pouzarii]|uniref:Uncharacterized protein n=1 Tax=Phellinidium pouzarii TaxID=167371 RepID=A0A4S4LKI1_9AGAM|nr:hypothetical protein EW145_g1311 [Phellinidium pouzarii]